MEIINGLLLGLAAAAGATFFPGMLNMTSVSVSLRAGRRAGYTFALGLALAFTSQAGMAVFFANYLTAHPSIISGMKKWATLVFVILAIFFLFKAIRARVNEVAPEDEPYHGSPLVRGIVMAYMNFLTIPYFFALAGWLLSDGYLPARSLPRMAFTLGAGAGALVIFGGYVRAAQWFRDHASYLTRNINFILGGLFVILAVVQTVRTLI